MYETNQTNQTAQPKTIFDIIAEEERETQQPQPGQNSPGKPTQPPKTLNTQITVPTLHEAAVLASLSISVPTLSKLDRSASDEVTSSKRADKGTARVNKSLVNKQHLKELTQIRDAARNFHYAQTVPWGDLGLGLLTNERLIDYKNRLAQHEAEFWQAVNEFLDKWDSLVLQAQLELGDLYNPHDYPSRDRLAGKFKFRVSFEPVPAPGAVDDIRTNLPDTVRREMKRQYEELMEERSRDVAKRIWEKLYTPLKNMSDRLDDQDPDGKPNRFKSTLVDNVLEIVELMKAFNLTNDPEMDRVRRELRDALTGVTTDGLKANAGLRRETKQKVDKVVSTVAQAAQIENTLSW